jgi:hypothetical protein
LPHHADERGNHHEGGLGGAHAEGAEGGGRHVEREHREQGRAQRHVGAVEEVAVHLRDGDLGGEEPGRRRVCLPQAKRGHGEEGEIEGDAIVVARAPGDDVLAMHQAKVERRQHQGETHNDQRGDADRIEHGREGVGVVGAPEEDAALLR